LNGCEYYKPDTLEEAMGIMGAHEDARFIAGGTDVMVLIKNRKLSPDVLISLRNIRGLSGIDASDGLTLGSGVTHGAIVRNELIQRRCTALADATQRIGSEQVRNVATIGGNICNAAPSADTACPLLVLDAHVLIAAKDGERTVPIEDFFLAPNRTVLSHGEIVKAIALPALAENSGSAYIKHTRRQAMELPMVGIAVRVTLDAAGHPSGWKEELRKAEGAAELTRKIEDGKFVCPDVRIALGVVSPTPMRARKAEAALAGRAISEALLDEVGAIAASESQPRDSVRGEAWYRKEMVAVLVKRAVLIALERIVNTK